MGSENFAPTRPTGHNLWHFFEVTHGHTDGQTHRQELITSVPLQNFFLNICEGEGGKLYKPYEISSSSLCEGMC